MAESTGPSPNRSEYWTPEKRAAASERYRAAPTRRRDLHQSCRECGHHLTTTPQIGGGQFVTCKCGRRQPGLPALWWAWDRLEQIKAIQARQKRRQRTAEE